MSYSGNEIIEGVARNSRGLRPRGLRQLPLLGAGSIGRVNLQKGEPEEEFIKPASPAFDVAVEPRTGPQPAAAIPLATKPDRQACASEAQERLPAKDRQG
jgi:hypothetical protein